MRNSLSRLKVGKSLKKYVSLEGRQIAYNAAKDIGITVSIWVTPETRGLSLEHRLFQIERIR